MNLQVNRGYRLPRRSAHSLLKWCEGLKHQALRMAKEGYAQTLANKLCEELDAHTLFPRAEWPDFDVMQYLVDLNIKASETTAPSHPLRDTDFDWNLTLQLYPTSSHTLFVPHYEQRHWEPWLKSLPDVECFHFWEGVPDEGVCANQWMLRKKAWQKALGSYKEPGLCFSVQLVDNSAYLWPSNDFLRHFIPSDEVRALAAVTHHWIDCEMSRGAPAAAAPHQMVKRYVEARRFVLGQDNAAELKSRTAEAIQGLRDVRAMLLQGSKAELNL